jgi:hypothetical protein
VHSKAQIVSVMFISHHWYYSVIFSSIWLSLIRFTTASGCNEPFCFVFQTCPISLLQVDLRHPSNTWQGHLCQHYLRVSDYGRLLRMPSCHLRYSSVPWAEVVNGLIIVLSTTVATFTAMTFSRPAESSASGVGTVCSIAFNCPEKAAVIGFVYIHCVLAAGFRVIPVRPGFCFTSAL